MSNWQTQTAAWRAEVQDWHPTPGPKSSIDYMVTEAAECLDAALRLLLPQHDRTNGKRPDIGRELAQVIDMACTAATGYHIDLEAEIAEWQDVVRGRQP